ncbi:hypothetical protein [Streptomyces canus]|uniref:hypothetical protein n=1 Tax=Streptomyces canus TaxID=58343 RepID=UPI002DDC0403|nr:hypothetical protein [Streptomyces canus]WSD85601.1 hypothetical protein OG925_15435 [Streptomyces canus]
MGRADGTARPGVPVRLRGLRREPVTLLLGLLGMAVTLLPGLLRMAVALRDSVSWRGRLLRSAVPIAVRLRRRALRWRALWWRALRRRRRLLRVPVPRRGDGRRLLPVRAGGALTAVCTHQLLLLT